MLMHDLRIDLQATRCTGAEGECDAVAPLHAQQPAIARTQPTGFGDVKSAM
jgi:hypothetical protein